MKCFHCQGELHRAKTVYSINRHGYHLNPLIRFLSAEVVV
jgi:hypothetical protein